MTPQRGLAAPLGTEFLSYAKRVFRFPANLMEILIGITSCSAIVLAQNRLHRAIGTKGKRDALGLPQGQTPICRSLRGCAPESTARHRSPDSRIIPPGYFLD
jgi:hypothetical protein